MTDPQQARISLVRPRLDEKPWGGTALSQFGMTIPEGTRIGEALVTANDASIVDGFGAGLTLGEVIANDPATRLGANALEIVGGRPLFPLLVKLIDARENLSIQVHPDDEGAAHLEQLGKTEAWHVLAAEPGSKLYLGLVDTQGTDNFARAAARLDGSSADHLRSVQPVLGETYLLPAGTVHALGAGVMVYEIQQPSDITWRLDDWGRVDAHGRPREMHRDQGLAAIDPELQPAAIEQVPIDGQDQRRDVLVATRYFALERWEWSTSGEAAVPGSVGPQVLTVLSGQLGVDEFRIGAGESAVIWPGEGEITMSAERAVVLRGWVPDASDTYAFPAMTR